MVLDKLQEGFHPQNGQTNRFQRDIPKAQETIYNYLLEIVKLWSPEEVLAEFKHLFIHHVNTISSHILPSLYEIVFSNQEVEFRNTLKRSCYILINNWDITRSHKSIQELIQIFSDPTLDKPAMSPTLRRLRGWLKNFVESSDFEQLKLFASKYDEQGHRHWSERYTSYLLVPQYIDLNNSVEQRHAARALSKQLKERFKFDLALYTARSQSQNPIIDATEPERKPRLNPTGMGDEVLHLVKMIVVRRGNFSHTNLANIFVSQTQKLTYREFKLSLQRYLVFSVEGHDYAIALKKQLAEKLEVLYTSHHDKQIDDALLLRTCNRVIEYLTTENHQEPSPLFVQLLSQGSPLTLVVILLKIILVCRHARTHLESRIANLVQYYKSYLEEDCRWVINFFEIFDITMAIYAENVEFNLVDMRRDNPEQDSPQGSSRVAAYRIFSQMKAEADQDSEFDELRLLQVLLEDEDPSE